MHEYCSGVQGYLVRSGSPETFLGMLSENLSEKLCVALRVKWPPEAKFTRGCTGQGRVRVETRLGSKPVMNRHNLKD